MKRISLVLSALVFAASVAALPLRDTPNVRLFPRDKDAAPPVSTETGIVTGKDATNQWTKKQSEETDSGTKESSKSSLPASIQDNNRAGGKDVEDSLKRISEARDDKTGKKNRRHKAIFVDYPLVPQLPFSNDIVPYDIDYPNNNFDAEETRTVADSNNLEESNIFYIRLPPTPYMFVPGLGYISQPPTYSTTSLQPFVQAYKRPGRPKPAYHQSVKHPFIKLPIDFVSNGKPTSVYHWHKKTNKKPTDTPITNLDGLSADFVTNGKPTAIYQWQSNVEPTDKPTDHDLVHTLDKGPYEFNGKPTSFFLLKPDGTTAARHPFRYSDYQDNSYY